MEAVLEFVVGPTLVAIVGAIAVILTKGVRAIRRNTASTEVVKVQTAAIREQVENSHNTNLREELDEQRETVNGLAIKVEHMQESLAELKFNQRHTRRDIGGLRQDMRGIREMVHSIAVKLLDEDESGENKK